MEPDRAYIRGQDGIPVLVDHSSNPSSPVNKKSMKFKETKTDQPVDSVRKVSKTTGEILKAVFTIDGEGYDVIFNEKIGRISWSTMNATGRRRRSSKGFSSFIQKRRLSITEDTYLDGLDISSLFGVHLKRRQKSSSGKEDEGQCLGIVLSMIEKKNVNMLREKTAFLEHPSEELCSPWVEKIKDCIKKIHHRPAVIKLFLQPFAGNKTGRSLYKNTISPLFQSAGVSVDLTEIKHNEFVKQEMVHLNLQDYDCIVCMGGDGTVNHLVNALLTRAQKEKDIEMKHNITPVKCPIPLGIIPTGKTNDIAQSVMGVADAVTATLHIIHGNFQDVDICSVYTPERFHQWAFNCQYGFTGQVLTFMKKYKTLGSKRIDAAVIKALTKSKMRAYECDIEYIPAECSYPKNTVCRTGCDICRNDECKLEHTEETTIDLVQELDPLSQSFSSDASSIIDLPQNNPWRSLKGKYLNVGLFTLPGISDYAPQGFSRYTHLNNGVIDLVLIKDVEKKEFVRHLRRFGNTKDPFDFPFVEMYRVKELRFRPRYPTGWNYNDHDFNEIKYQMSREASQLQVKKSVEVINDLDHITNHDNNPSIDTLDLSDEEDEQEEEKSENQNPPERLVGPMYRKTFSEIEREKHKWHVRKKEEKLKAKEQAKMVSVWSIDNQIVNKLELDFKVHHGLLSVSGLGVSPHTEFSEVRLGCLSGM
uniref:DAGKc domain-containing protein n=1 Tax=Biomphalaria glabrata TaxID=6526 RepID=A0A2C9LK89_BIOGL